MFYLTLDSVDFTGVGCYTTDASLPAQAQKIGKAWDLGLVNLARARSRLHA
jgi:hypothetical protein